MYSTASPPPKKEGAKSITPSGIKRGKTANRMATPVCIVADDTGKRNKHNKKAAGNPAAFRFLSELLRGHKSRASFPTVRANCVQAQPGPCGRRFPGTPGGEQFSGDPRD